MCSDFEQIPMVFDQILTIFMHGTTLFVLWTQWPDSARGSTGGSCRFRKRHSSVSLTPPDSVQRSDRSYRLCPRIVILSVTLLSCERALSVSNRRCDVLSNGRTSPRHPGHRRLRIDVKSPCSHQRLQEDARSLSHRKSVCALLHGDLQLSRRRKSCALTERRELAASLCRRLVTQSIPETLVAASQGKLNSQACLPCFDGFWDLGGRA